MKNILSSILFLFFGLLSLQAQNFSNGYHFLMPPNDSTTQRFLPIFEKKPITDFVAVSTEGEFLINDIPIRFWGVNFVTGACFPDIGDASNIVGRMRKMGINLVRFHHMDNPWSGEGGTIFNGINTLSFDPFALQNFHYLISKMKEEGIYANVNLLVSRQFSEADGIAGIDSIDSPEKIVSMFDGEMIQLQKNYASQLLTSYNVYTELPLVDDPVLAMVEINNENTIYGNWKYDYLQPLQDGGELLSRHSDTLNLKWNQFLSEKYGTQANLVAAWPSGDGASTELIQDGDFEINNINNNWNLELHNGAAATMSLSTDNPFDGSQSAKIKVPQNTGTDWYIQFEQNGFEVRKDTAYVVSFSARASTPVDFWTGVLNHGDPYNGYGGLWTEVTEDWQEYEFYFTPDEDNLDNTRLSFSLGEFVGDIFFDNISLKKFQKIGVAEGENLASANIKRIRYSERSAYANQRVADLAEFYIKLQTDYYNEMADYLRNTLNVKVPITGSNALGGLYEIKSAEGLDYIDDHAYWDHPDFSDGWSQTNWSIKNTPMLADDLLGVIKGLFGGLANKNQPYTISEYNHPSPNIYQTEMIPIIAGYGSFHGTDGIMFFEYNSGNPANWWQDQVDGFFSIHANPAIMSLFPTFAKAYRDHLIQEDNSPILAQYTEDFLYNLPQEDDDGRWSKYFPYDERLALTHSIKTDGFNHTDVQLPNENFGASPYTTNTDEITFDADLDILHINTPKLEALAGKISNMNQAADAKMQVAGDDFGVISWISLTEKNLDKSEKSLLTISSRFQNSGMIWDGTTSIHNNWGNAPTEMKPLLLDLSLDIEADSMRLFPLDGKGEVMDSITFFPQNGQFHLTIDQNQTQTPWFGIRSFPTITSTTLLTENEISIFPNPIANNQFLRFGQNNEVMDYRLMNALGQTTAQGKNSIGFYIKDLPTGIYTLILRNKSTSTMKLVVVE